MTDLGLFFLYTAFDLTCYFIPGRKRKRVTNSEPCEMNLIILLFYHLEIALKQFLKP